MCLFGQHWNMKSLHFKKNWTHIFLTQIIFVKQNYFWPPKKLFCPKYSFDSKIFFNPNFFLTNFWPKIFFWSETLGVGNIFLIWNTWWRGKMSTQNASECSWVLLSCLHCSWVPITAPEWSWVLNCCN